MKGWLIMVMIAWDEKYSVGIRELDSQHKQLVSILNDLYEAMQAQKTNEVLGKILNQLVSYTKAHFATEEKYMAQYGYPDLASQKREHEAFTKKVVDFKESFDSGRTSLSVSLTSFVKDWLFSHIGGSDKKYGPFLNSKGLK